MGGTKKSLAQAVIVLCVSAFIATLPTVAQGVEDGGYANPQLLVTTAWLAQHMNDADVRILDRQDIAPKDSRYAEGHIPNAIRMPTSAIKGVKGGTREMLILKDLVDFLGGNGVSAFDHIVITGLSGRLPAMTRVFWALDILGHERVSILDGGIEKWKAEKRPLATAPPKFAKVTYTPAGLDRERFMAGDELLGYLGLFEELGITVVDSRRPDEFKGLKLSRESDKKGHIPGAVNLFFTSVLEGDYKEFAAAGRIREAFKANNITPEKQAVFTCVSGCFGTALYFAARLMGYDHPSVYDGAWIEWSLRDYPAEVAAAGK